MTTMERRVVGQREICFSLDELSAVVDMRLSWATDEIFEALKTTGVARSAAVVRAREHYGIAFAIAALVDDRVTSANEWPVFTSWAAQLASASGGASWEK